MSLDPVTFIAQVINLCILMFLLYKFLYKPLLNAIDERQKKIASDISQAREKAIEAEKRLAEIVLREKEIETQKNAVLEEAYRQADNLRKDLIQKVHEEIAQKRTIWMNDLEKEHQNLQSELRTMIVDGFANFSKKALIDLADEKLEDRMFSVLVRKIDEMPVEKTNALKGGKNVSVTTAFPLSEKLKTNITTFLSKKINVNPKEIFFKEETDLLCGLEISASGHVLSWNLNDYLTDFSNKMSESLKKMSERVQNKEN